MSSLGVAVADRQAGAAISPRTRELRARELVVEMLRPVHRRTDRLFAGLLVFEWVSGVGLSLWLSPRIWSGPTTQTHLHLWAAVVLGGAVISLPVWLALTRPGHVATRHVIAAGQMLMSALLIHLTGGRIETHFHVFGSLALLSFYRDWRVLATASAVVAADHFLRGAFWPESVYGTALGAEWRWLEHTGWVALLDLFLGWSCLQGCREIDRVAERQAALEASHEDVVRIIVERTAELTESNARLQEAKAAAEAANRPKSTAASTPASTVVGAASLSTESILKF